MSDGDERKEAPDAAASGRPESEGETSDPFGPPKVPCECFCLHCRRTFLSNQIWFQKVNGARDGFDGFWMCPTPNCSGKGFTFDIFPVDANHPANEGWHHDAEYDEEDDEGGEWEPESDPSNEPESEYDPEESRYKELDEIWGDEDDDDIEGEEWKYGLQPGEVPESDSALPEFGQPGDPEEEALYNAPDLRPRELDWSDLERDGPGQFSDDDIPF
jgi:hypothetical protein